MAEWQPNPQELQQLVLLLQKSMSHSTAVQEEVLKQLHEYSNIPDYNSYLVVIFSKYDQNQQEIRLRAGILLKNNIQKHFQSFNPTAQVFIKNLAMQSIGDSYKPIRRIVAAIMGAIIKVTDPETWPEFLQILFSLLDNTELSVVDGSFITLLEITEDFSFQLTSKPLFSQFINNLLAKLIQFYSHPEPEFRNYALKILTKILLCKPDIINPYFSQFLTNSIALSNDSNAEVRKSICSLFITILSSNDIVYQHLQDIYPLFLAFLKDKDESVSLEACEFWVFILEYPDNGQFIQSLFPFVKDLVEILVKNLVYSEEERETLEADEQQQNERVDQQKDVKPLQHQKSPAEFAGEDDDDDIAATGEDDPNAWTLRKCSAKALDYLSGNFTDQLLPVFLPVLQSVISTPNAPWYVTESAILAIGAVAEGCYNGMTVYLPQLIPFLVQNLTHPNPLMRQISCWAIGRYSDWIVRQPIFPSILEILLKLIIDNSKAVQCASLSSFSEILDATQVSVLQFIKPILSTFSHALKIYQIRNMLLLYDSIGILCRTNYTIGNDPEIINIFSTTIIPQLIEKWKKTENGDIAICTLCNCFTSIALTFGPHFQPFVEPLFTRCLNLIEFYSVLTDQAEYGKSDNDFITFPLELLSGITEGVGPQIEPFVGSTNILSILFHSIKQRYGEIREVSYRLVGDLSRFAIVHMEKGLVPLVEELLKEAPTNRNTTLHAVEAVGDLIYNGKEKLNSVAPRVLEWILATLITPKLKQSIYEVTSAALGKFCIVFPDLAAPLLPNFVDNWCYSMSWLKRPSEREIAYKGLCHVITKNPNSIFNQHLNVVFKSIASCENPSSDLRNMFQQIIDYYKRQSSKEQWNQFVAQLQEFADVLHNNYKIRD